MPSEPSDISQFFPAAASSKITLANYLNSIASSLANLSPDSELATAFAAFDEDDSGQIDMAELYEALLHTSPEPGIRALSVAEIDIIKEGFSGRRALSKSKSGRPINRADVFKYREFIDSVASGNGMESGLDESL